MEELGKIVGDMWDELHGAKHYAEHAMKLKATDPTKANMYSEMARQELAHFESLHKMGQRMVDGQHGDDHEMYKHIWDFETDRVLEKAAKIRTMLDMAR